NWNTYQVTNLGGQITSIAIDSLGNKWLALQGRGLWKMSCTVPTLPTGKTGPDTVYKGQQTVKFKIGHTNDALTYHWTLPTGFTGSSNADSIIVNIDSTAVSGQISVYGHNSCGNGPVKNFYIVVKTPTGVDDINNDLFKLYPNPANDKLFIEAGNTNGYELIICDLQGKSVIKQHCKAPSTAINIDFLAKGVYFYVIRDKDVVKCRGKLLKK
ncbi:MAG: T9SS type A sorting domain-containing protein, partial [Bacteroidetes bacterium]|nr:T9SS type A sorting domain-containing protein [Bacteroidota bacterium]